MTQTHDQTLLGAYVLGGLGETDRHAVITHVQGCADCRRELAELEAMAAALGEVPPEAFLDGPPVDGDLLLQRTLRAARAETAQGRTAGPRQVRQASQPDRSTGRRLALVAAGVALLAAAGLGGAMIGRGTAPAPQAQSTTAPAGSRTVAATNATTGASMTATVIPAAGWVRVHAKVDGIKAGKKCQLVVTSRSGAKLVAGSWLVSDKGEQNGTALDGSALVAPDDVASVDVITFEGQRLVSAPI